MSWATHPKSYTQHWIREATGQAACGNARAKNWLYDDKLWMQECSRCRTYHVAQVRRDPKPTYGELEAKLEKATAVLRELARLKVIKDIYGDYDDSMLTKKAIRLVADYRENKPKAWAAAFELLYELGVDYGP